jgi:hypothetical protein
VAEVGIGLGVTAEGIGGEAGGHGGSFRAVRLTKDQYRGPSLRSG